MTFVSVRQTVWAVHRTMKKMVWRVRERDFLILRHKMSSGMKEYRKQTGSRNLGNALAKDPVHNTVIDRSGIFTASTESEA